MHTEPRRILSASRRTDIPAFYLDWFMDRMQKGCFDIQNPFNKVRRPLLVNPESFHTIVFWSKNFELFLERGIGRDLIRNGYHLYFNFTVNSENSILEPKVPSLKKRLDQLRALSEAFGPENIAWRFDPICHYKTGEQLPPRSNLDQFSEIAETAARLGIDKCVTSFFDPYAKISRRIEKMNRATGKSLELIDPPLHQKTALLRNMARILSALGIELSLCCEKQLFENLDPELGIRQNACIDGALFMARTSEPVVTKRDAGQRAAKGCRCTQSVDIGSYDDHPCLHNCVFCYARPQMDIIN